MASESPTDWERIHSILHGLTCWERAIRIAKVDVLDDHACQAIWRALGSDQHREGYLRWKHPEQAYSLREHVALVLCELRKGSPHPLGLWASSEARFKTAVDEYVRFAHEFSRLVSEWRQ